MNKKNKIFIIFGILIILLFVFFLIPKESKVTNRQDLFIKQILSVENVKKAILEIDDIKYESEISSPISVSDFMEKLKSEGKINFKEKNYAGMGKFINEINGIKNSGEKNWIYYVNGQKANIGVSNYKINPGDVVSWKYETSY